MRGIVEAVRGIMPGNAREWARFLTPLNSRYQIPEGDDQSGRAEVKNSRAEDQRFHRTVAVSNRRSAQTTSGVLTATDAGANATITISAHVVRAGSLEVSYDPGSITGLAYSTKHYVYADDEGLDGGAVAYAATTSYTTAITGDDRYYVGEVTTPAAAGPPNPGGGGGGSGGGGNPWP